MRRALMTSVWRQLVEYLQADLPVWLRRMAQDHNLPGPPAAPEPVRLAPPVRHAEMRRCVARAVARLPAVYVNVLVLADVQGRSCAEVGDALGLGASAAQGCV